MDQTQHFGSAADANLKDIAAMLWRRKWIFLLVAGTILGGTFYWTSRTEPRYRATAQMILVQRIPLLGTATDTTMASAPVVENAVTQVEMIQSDAMAYRTIAWLKEEAISQGKTIQQLGISDEEKLFRDFPLLVSVSVPKETSLIEVTANADNPHESAVLANAVCQAFSQWKKEIAQASAKEMIENLSTRALHARAYMLDAEQKEKRFKQTHRLVDVSAQEQAALNQYLARETDVSAARQELLMQQGRLSALAARLKDAKAFSSPRSSPASDSQVQSLQAQLNQLEIDKAKLSLRFNEMHPDIRNLNNQIAGIKAQLRIALQSSLDTQRPTQETLAKLFAEYTETRSQVAFAGAKLAAAMKVRDEVRKRTTGLPETSMQYTRLSSEATLARNLHSSAQSALNSAIASRDTTTGNIQVTSPATAPRQPYEPNFKKNMFTGGLLGVGLAFALVLLFEHADRRLRSMKDIRRTVHGQIVGTLPKLTRAQIQALEQGGVPPQAMEVYGMVRANLALAVRSATQGDPWRQQVILVTSAIPGEGKSITAATLARSIARAGKTVILVDADMRRPAQGRLFNAAEAYGLADVLAARLTLDDVLVASDTENLTLLPSGSPTRNPTELISRPQTAAAIARLRSEADVVVIDAPACSTVADALLLAPHVDNILYVIGAGQVSEDLVQETTHSLRAAAPKTMVFFINRAPREKQKRAYQNYYYQANGGDGASLALKPAPASVEVSDNGGGPSMDASPTMTLVMNTRGSYLTALEGPYTGQSFSLSVSGNAMIGRNAENTIILNLDPRVSRRHAHIALEKGHHILYDDGSANGTFVNEMRVTSQMLTLGDIVQFGESKFKYE